MFDVRYHAITVVAVLVALVIGLLLGVAVGDQGLVSGAERQLRQNLRADVESARATSRDLRAQLAERDAYESQSYPAVVADRLMGRRIALITLDDSPSTTFSAVRDAIDPAGGRISFVGRLRLPLDLHDVADAAAGTRFERLADDPDLLTTLGTRVGAQVVSGGRLVRQARRQLFASSSGALDGAEAVVLVRGEPPSGRSDEDAEQEDAYVGAVIQGLESLDTPVVGVERTDTDPSQVGWYQGQSLASVDNIDEPAGRTALVLALADGAVGTYGTKSSAEALLPETLLRDR